MSMLEGKVAIVTGGSQGIGRGCVERFVREGAAVVIGDVRDEAGQALAQSCGTSGGRAVFHHAEVSIGTEFNALVDRAVKEYGRLDILLNNAAVAGPYGPIEQIPEEDWDLCIGITPRSVFLGMKYAIPQLRRSGGGAIISIASGAAIRSEPFLHAYSAAKAAIVNLSQGVAVTVGRDRIRVDCICPGWIITPSVYRNMPGGEEEARKMGLKAQPIPKAGDPADIAGLAAFLASDDAEFLTGLSIAADGGGTAANWTPNREYPLVFASSFIDNRQPDYVKR
jgi:NAD(P)-dependent dehydrogenase (short-subunit alcohol dehydrogenase family)